MKNLKVSLLVKCDAWRTEFVIRTNKKIKSPQLYKVIGTIELNGNNNGPGRFTSCRGDERA